MPNARVVLAAAALFALPVLAQNTELAAPPLTDADEARDDARDDAQPKPAPVATASAKKKAAPAETPIGKPSKRGRGEEGTVFARGEVVVAQMGHGLAQALLTCGWAHCSDGRQWAGSLLLGGLGAGAISFLLTDGISGGPAMAINDGTIWGTVDGLFLLGLLSGPDVTFEQGLKIMSASLLVGTAIGAGLGIFLHPTSGQVAFTTSGGAWIGALTLFFTSPFAADFPDPKAYLGLLMAATNGGLALSGYLSTMVEMSRGRSFLINAGGVIGGLVGLAAFYFANLGPSQANLLGPLVGAGAVAGLAGGWLLTAGIDAPKTPEVTLAPVGPLGSPGVTLGARW